MFEMIYRSGPRLYRKLFCIDVLREECHNWNQSEILTNKLNSVSESLILWYVHQPLLGCHKIFYYLISEVCFNSIINLYYC